MPCRFTHVRREGEEFWNFNSVPYKINVLEQVAQILYIYEHRTIFSIHRS